MDFDDNLAQLLPKPLSRFQCQAPHDRADLLIEGSYCTDKLDDKRLISVQFKLAVSEVDPWYQPCRTENKIVTKPIPALSTQLRTEVDAHGNSSERCISVLFTT